MTKIGVVTFTRAEYGSLKPVMAALDKAPEFSLITLVGGMHLQKQWDYSADIIEADGFTIDAKIKFEYDSKDSLQLAHAMGSALSDLADCLAKHAVELLLIAGDRIELLPLASAATALHIPIAHISGGEITEGVVDDSVRHAISKLSHIHFVSNAVHGQRLKQLGEEPHRIHNVGDPGLDCVNQMDYVNREDFCQRFDLPSEKPLILVTLHPSYTASQTTTEIRALLAALKGIDASVLFTAPNSDLYADIISQHIKHYLSENTNAKFAANLGQLLFHSALACGDLIIGNSSSGIWEAPSYRLPAVNIGDRQKGRCRAANVIDCEATVEAIRNGISLALSDDFIRSIEKIENPYGQGNAATQIVDILKKLKLDSSLLLKRFIDMP